MIYVVCAAVIGFWIAFAWVLAFYIKSSHALEAKREEQRHQITLKEVQASEAVIRSNATIESGRVDMEMRRLVGQIEYHAHQSSLGKQVLEIVRHDDTMSREAKERYMDAAVRQLSQVNDLPTAKIQFWNEDGSPKGVMQ